MGVHRGDIGSWWTRQWRKAGKATEGKSRRRKGFGLLLIGLIVFAEGYFAFFILDYAVVSPSVFSPRPRYPLNVPIVFDYYQSSSQALQNTPADIEMVLWLKGTTPVNGTIVAGEPFTVSARAYMPHPKTSGSYFGETRLIVVYFQHMLDWPPHNGTTNGIPFGGAANLCRSGECICPSEGLCGFNATLNKQSNTFWSRRNDTFYFPISGQFQPVMQFASVLPNGTTSLLFAISYHQLGDITLNVEPASLAQNTYVGNASLILTIAVFVLGVMETPEVVNRILRFFVLKKKSEQLPQPNQPQTKEEQPKPDSKHKPDSGNPPKRSPEQGSHDQTATEDSTDVARVQEIAEGTHSGRPQQPIVSS